jgi:lipopolysaccharide export system protein LptA
MRFYVKQISFIINAFCFACSFFASNVALGLSADEKEPVQLSADSAVCSRQKTENVCTYSGNAKFIQGTTHLEAPIISVYKDNNKINKIVASGEMAHYSTQLDENNKIINAQAKVISVFPDKKLMTLAGNSQLSENQNKFSGPYIEYQLK